MARDRAASLGIAARLLSMAASPAVEDEEADAFVDGAMRALNEARLRGDRSLPAVPPPRVTEAAATAATLYYLRVTATPVKGTHLNVAG